MRKLGMGKIYIYLYIYMTVFLLSGCAVVDKTYINKSEFSMISGLVSEMQSKVSFVLRKVRQRYPEYQWIIYSGYRSPEQQFQLYLVGRRGIPGEEILTKTTKSKHMEGKAVDIYPLNGDGQIVRYPDAKAAYDYYGKSAKKLGLIWGGEWEDLKDYGHIELSPN